MSLFGDGLRLLKLVDKGVNSELYRQLGEWIDKVADLQKQNEALEQENSGLRDRLKFKGTVIRIRGHSFVEGDDEEICSRCAEAENKPIHLVVTTHEKLGAKATCPECKTSQSHWEPVRRSQLGPPNVK